MPRSETILGFCSEAWTESQGTWEDTHIGGSPVWPPGLTLEIPPCPNCSRRRVLLLQAYAPHSEHACRVLYIFGCNSIICSAGAANWLSIRVCKKEQNDQSITTSHASDNKAMAVHDVSWDTDSDSACTEDSEDIAEQLELLSLQVELQTTKQQLDETTLVQNPRKHTGKKGVKQSKKRERSAKTSTDSSDKTSAAQNKPATLNAWYIQVTNEPQQENPLVTDDNVSTLLSKYMETEKTLEEQGVIEHWHAEQEDDQSRARQNLETFQHIISRAPQQVLRYNFGATAIWPSAPAPLLETTHCNCGSVMVFELQVLASCLYYLQPDKSIPETQTEAGMNFATVAVFTCVADCTKADVIGESESFIACSQTLLVLQDDW